MTPLETAHESKSREQLSVGEMAAHSKGTGNTDVHGKRVPPFVGCTFSPALAAAGTLTQATGCENPAVSRAEHHSQLLS